MNVLLDTHAFLWSDHAMEKISYKAESAIIQAENLLLSIASIWEIQIKVSIGKLLLPESLQEIIRNQQEQNGIRILPITSDHIYRLSELPQIHKDPFDRMLIAQAQHENLTLVTSDGNIPKYAVQTAW
jgi:PIN domain nuclease of toxin-antitoxin system